MSRYNEHKKKERKSDSESDSDCENEEFSRLYRRIKHKMLCDPELMVGGTDAYADIYNTVTETLPIGSAVTFEFNDTLIGFEHVPSSSEIVACVPGLYFAIYDLCVTDPSQWTLFLNGIPHTSSTQGINTGSVELTSIHTLELNKGDVIDIRNYSSPKGTSLSINVGGDGTIASTNAEIIIFKVAPLCRLLKNK